ncbi:MAG: hypothetical protein LPJ89_04995 [Hymenobacteraceae bacterium]|nr:hypothetical protein [Hymenobacteraceae bacterium]MDX5396093.1 hypothetical protein [Hymenobacteraceae bacterium]MDX5443123.1 hypothetical protein [Hymenobacteraceae bacterium]MDX5512158.1 hypothetical protein [Hymenobacteraceae bacterium]
MLKTTALLLFFCLTVLAALAQEQIGLNPPSLKWRQISAPAGRIIYPAGLDSLAFKAAGIMAWQRHHDSTLVGSGKTKRIPTILQNQSAMPAGFSTPAPWRNEFYITPPQNLFTGPTPWLTYLTTHEYRHTQQFHMANKGTVLPFKILMGQTGWLLNALVNQPLWFREGDAVVTETALTNAGRGYVPRFHMETRALLLSDIPYSYELFNYPASYKVFIPNPYRLGYYMVNKARRDFGSEIWNKVIYDTHHSLPVYAFTRSLKKNTGNSPSMLFRETMQQLDSLWQKTDDTITLTEAKILTKTGKTNYTNYRFPHYLSDGSIIALKDALDEIRTFYLISPDGAAEKLFPYGIYTDDHIMFAGAGNLIAWAEASFDERWINQDYSIIKTYNITTGETKKLTSKTRYFAPSPSPDGSKIAAVHVDESGRNSLIILHAETGNLLQEWHTQNNAYPVHPRWTEDGKSIIALEVTAKGNRLVEVNAETGTTNVLLPFTDVPLSRPVPVGDYVYFSGGFTGIDNIYAYHRLTGKVYQVTSVRFGAYEPAVTADGKKLLYSSYTANGYRLEETELNPQNWVELPINSYSEHGLIKQLLSTEEPINLAAAAFTNEYHVKKYNTFTDGLFNIYGWFPTIGNNQYGLDFYTRNIMSTLRGTIGAFYNSNENTLGSKINLTYAALYPVLDLEAGIRTRHRAEIREAKETEVREQEFTERYISAGVRFPFRLTQGKYFTNMEVSAGAGRYLISILDSLDQETVSGKTEFNSYLTGFTFSRLLQRARQQVQPRWGQTIRLEYQKAIHASPERLIAEAGLLFPGLARTHSLNFNGTWKKESVQLTYRFADNRVMPRGFHPDPFRRIAIVSSNYELPLWYPDIPLGPVAFIQRFRTNLFYDHAWVKLVEKEGELNSVGAELHIDLRLLRLFSSSIAFRYSYSLSNKLAEPVPFQFIVTRFELAN